MPSKERCQCYLGLLLTPCIIGLVVWLTIRSSPPGFSIHKFTVPALNQTSLDFKNSKTINATISFEAKLKNENKEKGIYYDALNLTLFYYYEKNLSFLPIGNLLLPPFYQGREKTATRRNSTQIHGVPWDYARMKASEGNKSKAPALFRVNLETKVRYKSLLWKSKRHKISESVNITVNEHGKSCANSLHFNYLLLSNQVTSTIVGMILSSSIMLLL
ncbi:protein NDR1-like [Papaver somniferum]|uniref:protein NDR1-like n=1 Tax=Papaver somniferum TaxID=3469 RepID=UPI000E6F75EB|nr:protein NDR1-like [Papaver somniferum]